MTDKRPYPKLLTDAEQRAILSRAEQLWSDLQANDLGGYSGINRPYYIVNEFKRVIEEFGNRDVGLQWSKDQLDAHPDRPGIEPASPPIPPVTHCPKCGITVFQSSDSKTAYCSQHVPPA